MKSCPKCNRTFPDEGQKFCTFDGGLLITPQTFDPNVTIRATALEDLTPASEKPTSRDLPDVNVTMMETYPSTIALPRNTSPTGAPNTGDVAVPPPRPQPPPPTPAQSATSPPPPPQTATSQPAIPQPPVPQTPNAISTQLAPAKKKSKLPWIIVGLLLFLLVSGVALAGIFFAVIKPRLDEMNANRRVDENRNARVAENTNTQPETTPVEVPSPAVDSYVPPPNSGKFENSKDNLDGKLAEHYLDFSFYYPKSWEKDPKAGVPGASNFVLVERSLPPHFTQENFAVGWYTSSGTYSGDLPSYPRRVEEYSSSLAKLFPEYRKVSEGPTKINKMDAYEFRWIGFSKIPEKGDVQLWGRVVFLPTGTEGDTSGATLTMFSTSLAGELSSVEDVGEKGEMPIILESFRFGKKK